MTVTWIWEESSWGSSLEYAFEEKCFLGMGLEHAVGESGFLALDEYLVQRVVLDEIFHFFHRVHHRVSRRVILNLD